MSDAQELSVAQELNDRIVGAHIRGLRRAQNLRQADLGQRMVDLGFNTWRQQLVASVESGVRSLRFIEGIGVASILGCEAHELIGRTGPVSSPHGAEIIAQVTTYVLALAESGNVGAQRFLSPYQPPDNGSAAVTSGSVGR